MAKVILFARVSSIQQDFERQKSDLKELILKDGFKEEDILTISHKESATKNNIQARKSIAELTQMIETYDVKAVYVTEISRLARRGDVMYHVLSMLEERKISLVIQHPTLLRTYEDGKPNAIAHIVISFLTQVAQAETDLKLERQKSGFQQAIREGKVASPNIVFGYNRDKDGYAVIDKEKALMVRNIFNDYRNGLSSASIYEKYRHSGAFGSLSRARSGWKKVSRILREKTYIGKNKKYKYPPIIEESLFNEVQELIDSNKLNKTSLMYVYYCQGLVRIDGKCFTPNTNTACYRYYNEDIRKSYSISANMLDAVAFNQACLAMTKKLVEDGGRRKKKAIGELATVRKDIKGIESDTNRLLKAVERLNDLYISGRITKEKYEFEQDRLDGELKHLEKELNEKRITESSLEAITNEEKTSTTKDLYQLMDITDDIKKRDIVHEVIKSINVTYVESGHYAFTITYKDGLMEDDSFDYIQIGRRTELWHIVDEDLRENWSGTWDANRILDRQKRKRRGAK